MQEDALKGVLPKDTPLFAISSSAHKNLTPLLRELRRKVVETRAIVAREEEEADEGVIIELSEAVRDDAWQVLKGEERFFITGRKIEKFASRTNFDTHEGIQRLRDIMKKMGIMHHLIRAGLKSGDTIIIGKDGEYSFVYE
jgi:GTP-binding protein